MRATESVAANIVIEAEFAKCQLHLASGCIRDLSAARETKIDSEFKSGLGDELR
jgi:hypothetical protein